jgi:hypothetical protein
MCRNTEFPACASVVRTLFFTRADMKIVPLPKTENFYVARYEFRPPDDKVLTIYYHGYQFAYVYQVPADYDNAGMWTFNRGEVAIKNNYWPSVYFHVTLEEMLAHLEATFKEL